MKTRQERINFDQNYCEHYSPQPGRVGVCCNAGCDIKSVQKVEVEGKMKWGPCIGGHTLENPLAHCPKWQRRSIERSEKRADAVEGAIKRMTISGPFISAWRKKEPIGKTEVVECPVCKGRLHLSQSSYNGHVRACCETKNCINFIE